MTIIIRTWKSDGSTNRMDLEQAAGNLATDFVGVDRMDGLTKLVAARFQFHLKRGRRYETDLATFQKEQIGLAAKNGST